MLCRRAGGECVLMMIYRVGHPDHPAVEVAAVYKVRAVGAAAQQWGLAKWTSIARDCTVEELRPMPICANERRPVVKVNRAGDVVARYPSARSAAKLNFMNYQSVLDRCNGKVKKPYGEDGCTFQFDDGRKV